MSDEPLVRDASTQVGTKDIAHCASCSSVNITERFVWSTFDYGVSGDFVVLTVIKPLPVITCSDCKESFTDYRSEEIRDATVEQYRRVLAPVSCRDSGLGAG